MKAHYTVHYTGVIDIDDKYWDEMKEHYDGDLNNFVMVTICEDLGFYDEDAIKINHMELSQ